MPHAFTPTRTRASRLSARLLGVDAADVTLVREKLEEGFEPEVVSRVAKHLHLPLTDLFGFLGVPLSTFRARQRSGRPLPPLMSERVYQLVRVLEATETFFGEDGEAARAWLSRPKVALGGEVPLRFARSSAGAQYVIDLLGRLEHGVYS